MRIKLFFKITRYKDTGCINYQAKTEKIIWLDKGNYVPEPDFNDLQLFINQGAGRPVVSDTGTVRF
jgi:hypothetical protein